jgi:hypothetical protein
MSAQSTPRISPNLPTGFSVCIPSPTFPRKPCKVVHAASRYWQVSQQHDAVAHCASPVVGHARSLSSPSPLCQEPGTGALLVKQSDCRVVTRRSRFGRAGRQGAADLALGCDCSRFAAAGDVQVGSRSLLSAYSQIAYKYSVPRALFKLVIYPQPSPVPSRKSARLRSATKPRQAHELLILLWPARARVPTLRCNVMIRPRSSSRR